MSRALYERLCDIKERCEQLVEDVHGDPGSVAGDRVLAKSVLYDLHVIGEACSTLPEEFRARHPEVDWKGWKDFRNLTTHVYWRADATIALRRWNAPSPSWSLWWPRSCPMPRDAGVDSTTAELSWSLTAVGDRPDSDEDVQGWWRQQRR